MATLLIGYDIEKSFEPQITRQFIDKALSMHEELEVEATCFVLGRSIEVSSMELNKLKESRLFELEQHTYSHINFKTLLQENRNGIRYLPQATPEEIEKEIRKTNNLFEKYLGVRCTGLAIPRGFYRGLADRPDLLEILNRNEINMVRSYSRNEKDWQPLSMDIQPFFYTIQGYPNIMEFPVQGWQDCLWFDTYGLQNTNEYLHYLKENIDYIAERDLVWSYVQHDWSTMRFDPNMEITRKFVEYALSKNIEIKNHKSYYKESTTLENTIGKSQFINS